ncbi:MAG: hypothetical protein QWI73_03615 [Alphaproteobacteria bacterium]|nr:hypothetical protein [Alphaproteobacteria bacterium]
MNKAIYLWYELRMTLFAVLGLLSSALLFVYLLRNGSIFSIPLACCLTVPLYLITLNINIYAGLGALLATTAGLLLLTTPLYAIMHTGVFLLPAFFGASLLYFSYFRLANNAKLTLSTVFFDLICANIIIISTLLLLLEHIPALQDSLKHIILTKINHALTVGQAYNIDINLHEKLIEAKNLLEKHFNLILANMLAIYCLCFSLSNLYFATLLSKKINSLKTLIFAWPKYLFLPLISMLLLPLFLFFSFVPTSHAIELVANVGLVSFIIAFFAAGLAYLHNLTWPMYGRFFLLTLIYVSLASSVIFTAPLFITLTLMGLWSTLKYYGQYKYFI